MAFQYYEGTMDYLAATPALIITEQASGSITAGTFVYFDAGTSAAVYTAAVASGASAPAGFALQTASTGKEVAMLVWGYAKNIPYYGATISAGTLIVGSGSGCTAASGTVSGAYVIGKCITGSASGGTIVALIDLMK
jgi:hypothetical protein